jgi:soluble lytic murein transglycosylase-like protein
MKKVLSLMVFLTCAAPLSAQTRPRYVFDNFASGNVKTISSPAPAASPSKKTSAKSLVKKTAQQSPANMPVSGGYANQSMANYNGGLRNRTNKSLQGFTTGDDTIDSYILTSCSRYGVDPLLIYAQMNQESSFKLKATSPKGARGLMQLMPGTAVRFGVTDIYDPQQNIDGGVKYMRWLLDTFNGDVELALAGYNAGEGAVMKYGWAIPPYTETQDYVRRIGNRYRMLKGGSVENQFRSENKMMAPANVAPLPVVKNTGSINLDDRPVMAIKRADGKIQLVNQ